MARLSSWLLTAGSMFKTEGNFENGRPNSGNQILDALARGVH